MAPKAKAKKTIAKKPKAKSSKKKSYLADANNDGCAFWLIFDSIKNPGMCQLSIAGRSIIDNPRDCLTYRSTTTRAEAHAVNLTVRASDLNDDGRTTRAEARAARKAAYGRLA